MLSCEAQVRFTLLSCADWNQKVFLCTLAAWWHNEELCVVVDVSVAGVDSMMSQSGHSPPWLPQLCLALQTFAR